jgi:hypothetical protein
LQSEIGQALPVAAEARLHTGCTNGPELPADLALIVERWDALPEVVRAGIVAMVKAALPDAAKKAAD